MQRVSDNTVPYTPDNQIWNDYIEAFWGGYFRSSGFHSDFYVTSKFVTLKVSESIL